MQNEVTGSPRSLTPSTVKSQRELHQSHSCEIKNIVPLTEGASVPVGDGEILHGPPFLLGIAGSVRPLHNGPHGEVVVHVA